MSSFFIFVIFLHFPSYKLLGICRVFCLGFSIIAVESETWVNKYANPGIKLKLRFDLVDWQTTSFEARCVFVLGSLSAMVCVRVSIVIEIASRREMKRKVIESIEMKIKLNAYAHTFIHTLSYIYIQMHTFNE